MPKRSLLRTALICALVVCSSTMLARSAPKLEPFSVSGVVLDTRGKPLKGARVEIKRDFTYGQSRVTTRSDGRYLVRGLVAGTYRAFAYVEVDYKGKTICQRLSMSNPDDYNSFAVDRGAQRNFRWQLTGRVGYERAFFGASIRLGNRYLHYASTRAIEFTLTPKGPLVDGSAGKVIVRQAVLEAPASDDGLEDLPLGTYQLRAVRIGKDGSRTPVRVGTDATKPDQTELEIDWRSANRCGLGSNSGVKPLALWLEKPR